MKHNYFFEFENIILKPLEAEDIEPLRLLRNREREYFISQDEITKEEQERWFQNYLSKDDDIMFKVVKKEHPQLFIGAIALYDIDWKKKLSEYGRVVIDKELAVEKGIGGTAMKAVCLFGFEVLKLEKITGRLLKSNKRILKADMRAGFYFTGEEQKLYIIEMTRESINLDKRKSIFDYKIGEKDFVKAIATEATTNKLEEVLGKEDFICINEKFSCSAPFERRVVHELFCVGLISNVIENLLPGKGVTLLKQDFKYCNPVFIGDEITAMVEITGIEWKSKKIELKHVCTNQEGVCLLEGASVVKLY